MIAWRASAAADRRVKVSGPAVFLDRDGVLIPDPDRSYVTELRQVTLLPGAAEAVRELNDLGIPVVVVTNQAAIAKALLTEIGLRRLHVRLRSQLRKRSRAYYCPYHPEAVLDQYRRDSEDRKPKPGMLLRAAQELGLDLTRSYMIGDRETDMIAAHRAGCKAIAVRTGPEAHTLPDWNNDGKPDYVVHDLRQAVELIKSDLTKVVPPQRTDGCSN
jgi:D-glycero-D-manno-heptose 1,7-bisphosphate phosphatase